MKSQNPFFPETETQFDQWHAEKLPVGFELLCFKKSLANMDLSLPVFEKEGIVLTLLDHSGDLMVSRAGNPAHFLPVDAGTGILTSSGDSLILRTSSLSVISVVMISIPAYWVDRFKKDNNNFAKIAGAIGGTEKMVTAKLGRKQMPVLSGLITTRYKEGNDLVGTQNHILSLVEYFFCHCHKHFFRDTMSPVLDNDEDISLVREVEFYISEYYCSDSFTVDTILKKTYTSYHKLNFLFKSIHGMTISEYIRNKRIERSKEMIVDNTKSISQIAYEIGYSSISNYILAFKKIYRVTPGKYKKYIENVA